MVDVVATEILLDVGLGVFSLRFASRSYVVGLMSGEISTCLSLSLSLSLTSQYAAGLKIDLPAKVWLHFKT